MIKTENQNPGLFDRIASGFAPKGKKAVVDKMLSINTLLWMILILGAVRVIDASLKVNSGMGHPALIWAVAIFTLSLTEGGFVAWKNFRYAPTTNKAQKDVALGGMILSFTASVIVGVSDYIGLSMGDTDFVLGNNAWTGHEVMIWAFGIAYVIAIVGHVVCALLVREWDDDVQADNEENQIALSVKSAERHTRAAEQRTMALLSSTEREVTMNARVFAQMTLAPVLATAEALASVRRKLTEDYGISPDDPHMLAAINIVAPIAQEMTARVSADALRGHLKENNAEELGLNPEKIASSLREVGDRVAQHSRSLLAPQVSSINIPPVHIGDNEEEVDTQKSPTIKKPEPVLAGSGNGNGSHADFH